MHLRKTSHIIFLMLLAYGCVNNPTNNNTSLLREVELTTDSVSLFVSYDNAVFFIPSPQLVNMYLKRQGFYPDRKLTNPVSNIDQYTTTHKKALIFGVWGVDLGYMNIYSVADNTNDYLAALNKLAYGLGLETVLTRETYDEISSLRENSDSLALFLSGLFYKADQYLKNNSRQQTCAVIIAGAWIESFYLLCSTYKLFKNEQLKNIIFQQKFVLDNVIKALAPYYKSSIEMQQLVEQLVELAYDFDVPDFKYTYKSPHSVQKNGVTMIYNYVNIENEHPAITNIIASAVKLRNEIIK